MVTKNSINSNIPIEIAKSGTNTTSFSTATGITKYDGTSLVTSSTALIDSSDRYTNTSQPAFRVYVNPTILNVTGDGTAYTILFQNEVFDIGNHYNPATGLFTAPVAGIYFFNFNCYISGLTAAHTFCQVTIFGPSAISTSWLNPGVIRDPVNSICLSISNIASLSAGDSVGCSVTVSGGTKTVDIGAGLSSSDFSGYLLG